MSDLDDAYERFLLVDFEYGAGFANHGPMAVEALESIGHPALIPAFVDSYAPRILAAQPGHVPPPEALAAALGRPERAADWAAHFDAALGNGDWRAVALAAIRSLLPGLAGAAGHGLLRTVHALRALEREDLPVRRRELARGLAYWSANFRRLPGEPGRKASVSGPGGEPVPDPATHLRGVPQRPGCSRSAETFVESMARLEAFEGFRTAVEACPRPTADAVDGFLARLVRAAAALYVAHPEARIAYVHAVTIPGAVRWLAPRLEPEDAESAAGFAFQAVAAFHALFGATPTREGVDDEVARVAGSWDEIRYRAACSLEEHAVKLAEACWREHRLDPDPILALAAADAALRLGGHPNAGR